MIPKIVHLCWFSNDPYPVEIKMCLDSWHRIIPDYKIKVWNYEMAKAIGIPFIDEALKAHKWAFAADVVRFYAVWKDGGVYMDSDIKLFRRFDEFLPENGLVAFSEGNDQHGNVIGLQAAYFAGSAGNKFCYDVLEHYRNHHFLKEDGLYDETISPYIMFRTAKKYGYKPVDVYQDLGDVKVYPARFLAPQKRYKIDSKTIGQHQVLGSWRQRNIGNRIDIYCHHFWHVFKYQLGLYK